MREASASRVAADLCLLFLLFCFVFSPAAAEVRVLAIFAAVCLVCGFPAAHAQALLPRVLWTLPPLLLLFFASSLAAQLVLTLGWVYFMLTFVSDRFGMEYWVYRRAFCVMTALALVLSLWVGAAKVMTVRAPAGVLGFAAVFLLLGLHTLRAIRMGVTTDPGWKVYSLLELLLPAAAGGALFALLWLLLHRAGRFFTLLFTPFFYLIVWLTELIGLLFSRIDLDTSTPDITDLVPEETFTGAPEAAAAPPVTDAQLRFTDWVDAHPVPWLGIVAVLLAVAALILIVLYLRRSRRAQDVPAAELCEERFHVFRRRRAKEPAREHAARIRELYQSYLRQLQLRGQAIRESDTSEDILFAAGQARSDAERALRALYLTARYGDGSALTAADVAAAEACLEAIRAQ